MTLLRFVLSESSQHIISAILFLVVLQVDVSRDDMVTNSTLSFSDGFAGTAVPAIWFRVSLSGETIVPCDTIGAEPPAEAPG